MTESELIIVLPTDVSRRPAVTEFVGRCINYGVDFHFEESDVLPERVPPGLVKVRAIVIDVTDEPANRDALELYRDAGTRVYVLDANRDPTVPNARQAWQIGHVLDMLAMDAGLTLDSKRHRKKMLARNDDALFEALGRRMLESTESRWYDATRYIWEGLLDGYELTDDRRYLDRVRLLIDEAMARPNPLDNCDTITPLLPMLRVFEQTGERKLLDFAVDHVDRYLAETPRCRGCLVGFRWLPNHVRAEIIWQGCPVLAGLTVATGEPRYLDTALDQFDSLNTVLLDRESGLWRHGVGDAHHTGAYWARGVSFVLLGLIHTIEAVPGDDPRRPAMVESIRTMAETICRFQSEAGFWYTVIDDPNTEYESSGTAWMVAALKRAMRLGLLESSFEAAARKAWDGMKTRVWRGHFPGHNTATSVSPARSYYVKRHLSPTGWTHFAFRAACERLRDDQNSR